MRVRSREVWFKTNFSNAGLGQVLEGWERCRNQIRIRDLMHFVE